MKVELCYNSITETIDVNNFYKEIAEKLVEIGPDPQKTVKCFLNDGSVTYELRKRSGTIFIVEVSNSLPDSYLDYDIHAKYLTCIDPQKNSYKFYRLTPQGSEVKASWGRMGVSIGDRFGEKSFMYSMSMFWIKYQEKIAKGYIDQTSLYITDEPLKSIEEIIEEKKSNSISKMLFQKLRTLSKRAVERAKVSVPITQPIINESKRLLDKMRAASTVAEFNDYLLKLMSISQRPVRTGDGRGVKELMAESKNDFKKIILRETDLIQAMEGVVTGTKHITGDMSDFNVEVYEANEKQKEEVMKLLSKALHGKVKRIYRVIPVEQQKRFNEYLKKNNIKSVKQYWHGSRNENWLSIIKNGLQLNPNAVITGKMFGQGIYFAPSSLKSWNYTSFRGTSWARGTSDIAFMGIYATAYGTPYDVNTWSPNTNYNKSMISENKANCLHTSLPLAYHEKYFSDRLMTTNTVSVIIPFDVKDLQQHKGIYYGQNAVSKRMILADRTAALNPNSCILGMPGSGKSFYAKREAVFVYLNTDDEIYILDPEREYTELVKALDGTVIKMANGTKNYV